MSRMLSLRVSDEDYERLERAARTNGVGLSDYARGQLGCANPTKPKNGRGSGMTPIDFSRDSAIDAGGESE